MASNIKIIDNILVNQICSGEIIERPAAIIKELVENSIDAGSKNIIITIHNGGKTFISVKDDGCGMSKEDLSMCVLNHATSKIVDRDIINIKTMGFRGEALSSIGFCSTLTIKSRENGSNNAFEIEVDNSNIKEVSASNLDKGTLIEVRNIFFKIPVRLKFLRSNNTETQYIYETVNNLALSHPHVSFTLYNGSKKTFDYKVKGDSDRDILENRVKEIMGEEFIKSSVFFMESSKDFAISGFTSLATYNSSQSKNQHFFVNKRPIKDKFLYGALKASYSDILEYGRNPISVIFFDIKEDLIDINVSPTKSEVRFLDTAVVRSFIVNSIKHNLKKTANQETSPSITKNFMGGYSHQNPSQSQINKSNSFQEDVLDFNFMSESKEENKKEPENIISNDLEKELNDNHLGYAKAQFHKNWIIAENKNGIVVIDQHAAHERIMEEKLTKEYEDKGSISQQFLVPVVIELKEEDINILLIFKNSIDNLGINFDIFGEYNIILRGLPAILIDKVDNKQLILDIVSDLKSTAEVENFYRVRKKVISTMACHGSIRSGHLMPLEEMNHLLRQIETTENSAQCSHGRPTFVKIDLKELEKLFNRR